MSLTLDKQNQYREKYAAKRPGWQPATTVYEQMIRDILQTMPNDMLVLDMGCGRGGVIEQLTDLEFRSIGIDPDFASIQEHRLEHFTGAVANSDDIPLPTACVDVIISAWVLEHLPNPEKTFSEIARVLKPGGMFIFIAPNKNSPITWLNRALKPLQNTLVPMLYGRAEDDTFPVKYLASSKTQLIHLTQNAGLTLSQLYHIEDPTYLAFNSVFFQMNMLMSRTLPENMRVHLVGVCYKK
ncbi:MAG: class I SAM-dependent methyltransferase [Aggregatilineales bacterium]